MSTPLSNYDQSFYNEKWYTTLQITFDLMKTFAMEEPKMTTQL